MEKFHSLDYFTALVKAGQYKRPIFVVVETSMTSQGVQARRLYLCGSHLANTFDPKSVWGGAKPSRDAAIRLLTEGSTKAYRLVDVKAPTLHSCKHCKHKRTGRSRARYSGDDWRNQKTQHRGAR